MNLFWQPYHPWVWPVIQISVIIGHSHPIPFIFAICRVVGWQQSIRRPTWPKDDDRDNVDKHRDDDKDDDVDDHHGACPKDYDCNNIFEHRDDDNDNDDDDRTFCYVVAGIGVVDNGGRDDCCPLPPGPPLSVTKNVRTWNFLADFPHYVLPQGILSPGTSPTEVS